MSKQLEERPPKAGKFAEDEHGNTFLVLSIANGLAVVEHVNTKQSYVAPVGDLIRCTMIEETL